MQRIIIFLVETRDGLQIDVVYSMFLCVIPAARTAGASSVCIFLWKDLEKLSLGWISHP